MYRRIGLALAAVCVLTLSKGAIRPQAACSACGPDGEALKDLLVGSGLMTSLVMGLSWLETAALSQVAVHLTGLALSCMLVFFIAR